MNLILIGMRGAGKSNVSRRLSVLTKRPVLSTDLLVEYEAGGMSIAEIVASHDDGWRYFRDREYDVVQKVARLNGVIVDCGGGVIVDLDEDGAEVFSTRKIETLRESGTIIWLKGDIKRLVARAKKSEQRPTLDARRSAEEVMTRRLPFYEKAADVVVDIEGKKRSEIAAEINRLLAS